MKLRHEGKEGENATSAQRVQGVIHTRDGQLTESAGDVVDIFVVNSHPSTARFVQDDHQRARVRLSRMLDQTGNGILIETGVHLFGQNRVDAMEPRGVRCAALRYQNIRRPQRARAKIRFSSGKNARKITENVA